MFYRLTRVSKIIGCFCIRRCSQTSRFKGKIALITGSTQGIGLATARKFAQEGAKVIISSRKQENVDSALKMLHNEGLDVIGLASHVAKKEDRNLLLYEAEKLGGIDILVQNAGANPNPGKIINCTESMWDKIMDTNLKATFFLAKEVLPLMKKRGGGSIILMSSVGGYEPFKVVGAAYSVSKTGLLMLTKAMAGEFAEYNIRVNCVAPGTIKTNFAQILLEDLEETLRTVPLNRCGEPEEVSGVIAFLASQDASYITGESVAITGGMHTRL
ncbi:hypothetical protein PPYR_06359 [Photinus pyralis]|uniref:Dehydrogenase/reductase SDR family member 4 n=2 Tax=Photinus pyralis TaxID=7054 RepID=A0A5N4ATH8_PHOPY|nr:dehydrogenase/reductase SDR family member 4-like [Photinus pyralis]KAB0800619.1 hypothetical protein PPYR_06359 [Photinus pyralis]